MTTAPPDLSSLRIRRDEPAPRSGGGRRWLVPVLALVVVAALIAGWQALRPRTLLVRTATVNATGGSTIAGEGITANGYVVARTKASVSAKVMGRMEYLGVREGSYVRRGAVLAGIESADYAAVLAGARSDVVQTEAQLIQARRDLERARTLEQEQLIPASQLEDAGTRMSVLEAQLASARARAQLAAINLENTNVRAPFDGTVLRKDAEVGEIVAPSSAGGGLTRTAIVTMADLTTLEVEVDVNEAYIAQIRSAQPSRITLDAYPDTSFVGAVRQVVPTADRQKATVQVKVEITDRDPRILPEMGAKVVFLRESGSAAVAAAPVRVMVPQGALVAAGGVTKVWVVEAGKAVGRPVSAGTVRGEQVEIRSGLSGGETVIVDPPAGLADGVRVRSSE